MKKMSLTLIALLILSFGLTACETIKGVGRDLQNAGQAIDNAVSN